MGRTRPAFQGGVRRAPVPLFLRTVAALAAAVLLGMPAGVAGAADRPTVVSINACTDQLVLGLADPEQIASVSNRARSPAFSYMSEEAAAYSVNHGHAEEVLAQDPDLVVSGPYTKRETRERLDDLGYRVVTLDSPKDFPAIRDNIRRMAELLGHPERGERLVAGMDRTLEAVSERLPPPEERLRTLAVRPNGVTVGEGALLDTLIQAAGLRNVGREVGAGSYKEFPLEHLVSTRPDFLILAGFADAEPSLAQGVMQHPVFASLETRRPRMWLPGRLWNCGGWFNAKAVARLAEHAYGIQVSDPGKLGL